MPKHLWACVVAIGALSLAGPTVFVRAETTPALTIRDVLALSSFGAASIAPDGRHVVWERRGPYDSAPAFDLGHRSVWGLSELWVADLAGTREPERLLPAETGTGLLIGAWSPSGGRLMVWRLRDRRLEAGIVELADRTVWWTGLTPEVPFTGSTSAWIDDDRIGLTVLEDGQLPWLLRYDGGGQIEIARRWDQAASGERTSRTVVDARAGVARPEAPARERLLVVLDIPTETRRVLGRGAIRDWSVSPDGRVLAIFRGGAAVPVAPEALRQSAVPDRGHLSLIDVASGATTPLSEDLDVAPHLLRWSPSSSNVLVWARRADRTWRDGDLIRVDRDGGVRRVDRAGLSVLAPDGDIDQLGGIRADWLGDDPMLWAWNAATARFDWYLLRPEQRPRPLTEGLTAPPNRLAGVREAEVFFYADGALWSADAEGRTRRSPIDMDLSDAMPVDRMKPVRLRFNDPPTQGDLLARDDRGHLFHLEPSGAVRALGNGAGAATTVLSATGSVAVRLQRVHGVERLSLSRLGDETALDVVNLDLAGRTYPRPVPLRHADRTGAVTTSWLFLPPDRPASAARGIVVLAYPGAVDDGTALSPLTLLYGPRATLIAAEGYAVLSPAIPVSRSGNGDADGFVESLDLAMEAALAAHPDLPGHRSALVGHSYGGTLALEVAGRSNRFRSYIAWAPASDLLGTWGEFTPASRIMPEESLTLRQQMGWTENNQGGRGAPPWVDPGAYLAASPYLSAHQIQAPVLLITADRDFVPMSQAERVFSVLWRNGGQARIVTYWGEGHFNYSPANILDVYSQILAWLDQTLTTPRERSSAPDPDGAPRP